MAREGFSLTRALLLFVVGYVMCTTYLILGKLTVRVNRAKAGNEMISRATPKMVETVQSVDVSSVPTVDISDYPFTIDQSFVLAPDEEFDVTLVTYFSVQEMFRQFKAFAARWEGAINIVVYFREDEKSRFDEANELCKSRARTRCIPYVVKDDVIPINKFKNMGIDKVITTHFLFVENNLSPTTNLYGDILKTPGYLWRDPSFVGVIPVFEWSSDMYKDANAAYQKYDGIPNGPTSAASCLKNYHCRPMLTTTIPMQFVWFSFVNYRAMNCIHNNTDVYMVLKKSPLLPRYDESIVERGYDNTEYVEKIRYSNMKAAILCSNFLFRVSGYGIDINAVMNNRNKPELISQYEQVRNKFLKTVPNIHPIVTCNEIEPIMTGWVSFKKYTWMEEVERDGTFYPKIAVKAGNKVEFEL